MFSFKEAGKSMGIFQRKLSLFKKLIWLVFLGNPSLALAAEANALFGQLQIELRSPRLFTYQNDEIENRIDLALKDTLIEEFKALDYYDERLVKRIIIKQLPDNVALVRIFLKHKQLRSMIKTQTDPFRILIDIFSPGYQQNSHQFTQNPGSNQRAAIDSISVPHEIHTIPNSEPMSESLAETASNPETSPPGEPIDHQSWAQAQFYPPYVYETKIISFETLAKDLIDPTSHRASAIDLIERARKACSEKQVKQCKHFLDQAIRQDSNVFVENKGILWNYAELNLFSGNLELANGYYQVIRNSFPASPEAQYSKLRSLDVRAIHSQNQHERIMQLGDEITTLNLESPTDELKAWFLIRQAFWSSPAPQTSPEDLPKMPEALFNAMQDINQSALQKQTQFLLQSLMLTYLVSPEHPWQANYGPIANQYFNQYKNEKDPIVSTLKDKLKNRLLAHFKNLYEAGNHAAIIASYEALPGPLHSIKKSEPVAWIAANAYMANSRNEVAFGLFQDVLAHDSDPSHQFLAAFHAAYLGKKGLKIGTLSKNKYDRSSKDLDRKAESLWTVSDDVQKSKWVSSSQAILQDTMQQNLDIRTANLMLLYQLENLPDSAEKGSAPSRITTLSFLAKSFARLGLSKQRQKALELLAKETPGESSDTIRQSWVLDMQSLSEDYRAAGDYLRAGQTLHSAASQSVDWEKKAESFYKSGLLLLRAGRRNEAAQIFTDACNDDSNVYYQTLSCERLAQLENQ